MGRKALVFISGFLLFPSFSQAQVTLSLGTATGYRGSHNNAVAVNLNNPADLVRKVQVEVCDVDNYLDVLRCDTTTRSRDGFTCGVIQLPSGCARLILNTPTGGFIPTGNGSVMTIRYNVSAGAPAGQSRAINQQNIFVYDELGSLLTVTPVAGSFTFSSCSQSTQCQDGLYCNGTDACSSGACTHTGNPCPGTQCNTCQEATDNCFDPAGTACTNDGLFCNGDEICNGSGSCVHSGSPCPYVTCVEADDECTCEPGQSCEDNKYCNGEEFCLFGVCEHVGDPCTSAGLHCSEEVNRCVCFVDAECDDDNGCTDDRCESDGSCRHINNSANCDDGIFCNGADTCSCGSCTHAGDPCSSPDACNETTDACLNREVEMTLGFGSGAIGTADRLVNVQMKNSSDSVSGIQMTVCDENDYLIGTGCTVASAFDAAFDCTVNELANGCASAVLTRVGSTASIPPSSTMRTIFNIGFDVSPCRTRGTGCATHECSVSHETCTNDSDCGPGRCSVSTLLCESNQDCGRCSVSLSSCKQNSDCPSGETCIFSETCVFSETCSVIGDCDCYLPGTSCAAGSANCYRYDRNKLCNCDEEGCYSMEDACPVVDTGDIWLTIEDLLVVDPGDNGLAALAVDTPFANFEVTCDSAADCSRGSACSTDTCSGGTCNHVATSTVICNDGLFCTSTDRCSGGFCVGTGDTCGSIFLCNESTDVCISCTGDADCDGVPDSGDNCPAIPNGPSGGICITGSAAGSGCLEHCDCGLTGSYCSSSQEDSYPPGGNNLGDACECEGNFDCDTDVDGTDASRFKTDFGRSKILNPCSNTSTCKGDFDCDVDVDGTDASLFKKDFGRSSIKNPCPACVTSVWCSYP